eukprot:365639-Chlamydomonas_euryale.AAC.6
MDGWTDGMGWTDTRTDGHVAYRPVIQSSSSKDGPSTLMSTPQKGMRTALLMSGEPRSEKMEHGQCVSQPLSPCALFL